MLPIELPIENLPRISRYFISRFKNLGIKTIRDLLYHFPVRHEDFRETFSIAALQTGERATIEGIVKKVQNRRAWRRRNMTITEATIEDETGEVRAIWFNQSYVQNQLKIGRRVSISGKITLGRDNNIQLSNPNIETICNEEPYPRISASKKHTGKLIAKYPETQGLTSKGIRHFVDIVLRQKERIQDPMPGEILRKLNFPEINEAIKNIHQPADLEEAEQAEKRFSFENLFYLQLFNLKEKQELAKYDAPKIPIEVEEIKSILPTLPFELTTSQKAALWEIVQDLGKNHPMNRLLQGDVGSGKTIVVAVAALLCAKKGFQAAFMAPTEILARQHFETMKKFFPKAEVGLALLTSSESRAYYDKNLEHEAKKSELKKSIESNALKIVFGTHALIQKDVCFKNLALVVIDEQHRFGVRQRATLTKSSSSLLPHFLSMSATPIPRTLSLTLWGDLDLSLINELPKNREPITTKVVAPEKRNHAYAFIRNEVKKGRQVFVVCPRIEPDEYKDVGHPYRMSDIQTLNIKSVKQEYEKLVKYVFPTLKVAMLHGKMKPKEKEEIMKKFSAKGGSASGGKDERIDILVSTSVIEVGVDIPNATIMMIESADRFGLAQLYQFRGRVGRGTHKSYCLLFTESSSKGTTTRLAAIEKAKNGMELAEYDLKTRGPGEFLGEVQTGMPDLAMKALQHPTLVKEARYIAKELLEKDPALQTHPLLREHLKQFQTRIHWE